MRDRPSLMGAKPVLAAADTGDATKGEDVISMSRLEGDRDAASTETTSLIHSRDGRRCTNRQKPAVHPRWEPGADEGIGTAFHLPWLHVGHR
jgi:hypothetical protein